MQTKTKIYNILRQKLKTNCYPQGFQDLIPRIAASMDSILFSKFSNRSNLRSILFDGLAIS